jgi:hypothetical protein
MEFSVEDLPQLKKSEVDWSQFDYPIESFTGVPVGSNTNSTYQEEGDWNYGPVLGEENAPNVRKREMVNYYNFEKVYYAKPGMNDDENWTFLVKHKNGYFVFFDAGCDYTGFECQGGGSIKYSKDGNRMWLFGLDESTRKLLKQQ